MVSGQLRRIRKRGYLGVLIGPKGKPFKPHLTLISPSQSFVFGIAAISNAQRAESYELYIDLHEGAVYVPRGIHPWIAWDPSYNRRGGPLIMYYGMPMTLERAVRWGVATVTETGRVRVLGRRVA